MMYIVYTAALKCLPEISDRQEEVEYNYHKCLFLNQWHNLVYYKIILITDS